MSVWLAGSPADWLWLAGQLLASCTGCLASWLASWTGWAGLAGSGGSTPGPQKVDGTPGNAPGATADYSNTYGVNNGNYGRLGFQTGIKGNSGGAGNGGSLQILEA